MAESPKSRHGGRQRRLADMTINPQEKGYTPPPREECFEQTFRIPLADDSGLMVRMQVWRGRIVDFAITQTVEVNGESINVARIDCCWGTIHRHQYNREGVDLLDHQLISEIPDTDGWTVVEKGYDPALALMQNDWEDNLRRWRGDTA